MLWGLQEEDSGTIAEAVGFKSAGIDPVSGILDGLSLRVDLGLSIENQNMVDNFWLTGEKSWRIFL